MVPFVDTYAYGSHPIIEVFLAHPSAPAFALWGTLFTLALIGRDSVIHQKT